MLVPLQGLASALAATRPSHECRDHVCFCRPQWLPPEGGGCHHQKHEQRSEGTPRMRGYCNHEGASALLTLEPHLLPAAVAAACEIPVRPTPLVQDQQPAPGFRTPDIRPPRTLLALS
jgi:hypothetical protein